MAERPNHVLNPKAIRRQQERERGELLAWTLAELMLAARDRKMRFEIATHGETWSASLGVVSLRGDNLGDLLEQLAAEVTRLHPIEEKVREEKQPRCRFSREMSGIAAGVTLVCTLPAGHEGTHDCKRAGT